MRRHESARLTTLSRQEARHFLTGQLGFRRRIKARSAAARNRAIVDMLNRLGCVQLDPLDAIGQNADLVTMARIEGVSKGQIYDALLPGHAFEHFAKERCLLPAHAFAHYQKRARQVRWWRLSERLKRIPEPVLTAVRDEVVGRGPISARELTDHGSVRPIDWSGWKSTSKTTSMALEVLWTRCEVVVAGRQNKTKLYDAPTSLGTHRKPKTGFAEFALQQRVEAAGLLRTAGGPQWGLLRDERTNGLVERMVEEGVIERVQVEGSSRSYLAPGGFRSRRFPPQDDKMRIVGPLDPLIWDRDLVRNIFAFDYVWEVYKPAAKRRFGWYVCPLFHNGQLVGRVEGRVIDNTLAIERAWKQACGVDRDALKAAVETHAVALGAERVKLPRKIETA